MKDDLLKRFKDFPLRKKMKDLSIGVIAGGMSPEREVSLLTGKGIYKALLEKGYNAEFIDFSKDKIPILQNIDLAFIALHGKFGEDGTIQGLLELLRIPYTGSGVLSSAIAMDKIYTKKIFNLKGIPTPPAFYLKLKDFKNLKYELPGINKKIKYPVIVKPNRGGSTIGVTILKDDLKLGSAIDLAFKYDDSVIIEKYIKGILLTVSIIGTEATSLPIIEIRPKSGFYDYKAKYTPGFTEYIVPAPIGPEISKEISSIALKCHKSLKCAGLSRVDLIMDDNKNPYFLEVNTIPGMTPTSLVPKAAFAAGIDFGMLVEIILNSASLKV